MSDEAEILKRIMLAAGHGTCRLFRNSVGMAWQGREAVQLQRGGMIAADAGDVLLKAGYRVRYGLAIGSGDLIGWETVTVDAAMIGKPLAVFASIEAKGTRGRPSDKQEIWNRVVNGAGGLAGFARTPAEALQILKRKDGP